MEYSLSTINNRNAILLLMFTKISSSNPVN